MNGCSACEEDQIQIQLINGLKFKVCFKMAQKIKIILDKVIKNGFEIEEVIGYRAQMSKGDVNGNGERTQFSNHSYGLAIDINPKFNGLYSNCFEWNSEVCRLIKGGRYNPQNSKAIKAKDFLVKELKKIGFKWGGEIKGRQKDFMHFSFSGY